MVKHFCSKTNPVIKSSYTKVSAFHIVKFSKFPTKLKFTYFATLIECKCYSLSISKCILTNVISWIVNFIFSTDWKYDKWKQFYTSLTELTLTRKRIARNIVSLYSKQLCSYCFLPPISTHFPAKHTNLPYKELNYVFRPIREPIKIWISYQLFRVGAILLADCSFNQLRC